MNGKIETQGTMMLILSMVIGSLIGEWLDIEEKMEHLGEKIKTAVKAKNDTKFVDGFVNVSLIICIGAMAIVGSIQDGIGAAFSAILIFLYQGSITVLAAIFGSFVSDAIISDLSFVGSVLIFCVGINGVFGKRIKVGNMLPALIVVVIYDVLKGCIGI